MVLADVDHLSLDVKAFMNAPSNMLLTSNNLDALLIDIIGQTPQFK